MADRAIAGLVLNDLRVHAARPQLFRSSLRWRGSDGGVTVSGVSSKPVAKEEATRECGENGYHEGGTANDAAAGARRKGIGRIRERLDGYGSGRIARSRIQRERAVLTGRLHSFG